MGKKEVLVALDIILRLTLPLFLWQNPILVTVLSALADLSDGLVLNIFAKIGREAYQRVDKILDFYFHTVAAIYLWGKPLFYIYLAFYLLRLCGIVLLEISGNEKILLFFPNVIEFILFLYIFTLWRPQYSCLLTGKKLYLSVGVIAVLKTIQEYLMHRRYFCLRAGILRVFGLKRLAEIVTPPLPRGATVRKNNS